MREGIPLPADANLILAKKKKKKLGTYPCTTEPVYIMVAQIILLERWLLFYNVLFSRWMPYTVVVYYALWKIAMRGRGRSY